MIHLNKNSVTPAKKIDLETSVQQFFRKPLTKLLTFRYISVTSEGRGHNRNFALQFARIHTSSLNNIEKISNRPITKFYNSDDVNVIAAELRLAKMRPISFYKKHDF